MLYTHKTVCKTVKIINHQTTIRKGHIFSSSICLDVASPDAKLILLILLIVTIFRRHFHHGTCDTLTWCNYLHTGTEHNTCDAVNMLLSHVSVSWTSICAASGQGYSPSPALMTRLNTELRLCSAADRTTVQDFPQETISYRGGTHSGPEVNCSGLQTSRSYNLHRQWFFFVFFLPK